MSTKNCLFVSIAALAISRPAPAQSPDLVYSYQAQGETAVANVSPGGSITFPSTPVGSASRVNLLVQNRTAGTVRLTEFDITPAVFSLTSGPTDISPGGSGQLTMQFKPATPERSPGKLAIRANGVAVSFNLAGTGVGPSLVLAYLPSGGNQTLVDDGGQIVFPAVRINESTTAVFSVINRGNAPAGVTNVTVTGDGFANTNLPLLPAQVQAGGELRFNVVFTARSPTASTGSLRIDLGGTVKTIQLRAQTTASGLAFEWMADSEVTRLDPGGQIGMPDTAVGRTSTVTVRIRNVGNAEARIVNITLTGTAFKLADALPLPATVAPGGSFSFPVSFLPVNVGEASSTLNVDGVGFTLKANGVGSRLRLSLETANSTSVLEPNGTALFPNTPVGTRLAATLRVTNAGNLPAVVSSVSLSGTAYLMHSTPALPVKLEPGESLAIVIVFVPDSVGPLNGAVQVDDQVISLRGIGNPPPTLTAYVFNAPEEGAVSPLQQPAVGVTVDPPYALDLTGKLNLNFASDSFIDDPMIQFATGGREVDFRITSGSSEAIFSNGAKQIQFQVGTVAGTITVTPRFFTAGVDISPKPPVPRRYTVPGSAPVIRSVQVGNRTPNSLELTVIGYSTTRSVGEMTFRFTGAPGANLQTGTLSAPVETAFAMWYESIASRAAGSQFQATVRINSTQGEVNAVQSVAVSASNAHGRSPEVSADAR